MEKLTSKETKHFVWLWNEANDYPQGPCLVANMRYVDADLVTWNEYDAPEISISQVVELAKRVKTESPSFEQIATQVLVRYDD